jgi:hypothetical protein
MNQEYVLRTPYWKPGQNTQCANLLSALDRVRGDRVLVIEDDDWYAPDYLETMDRWLDQADLAGEARAKYYNVFYRNYFVNANLHHASLCQTAFHASLIPTVMEICRQAIKWPDLTLWNRVRGRKFLTQPSGQTLCVGIKGLPGRTGIGMGHSTRAATAFSADPDLKILHQWIGEDAETYAKFAQAQEALCSL